MSNEPTMYAVKIPNGLMEFFSETGAFKGMDTKERPVVGEELKALKWGPKGATGEVSLYTLGWMADQAQNGYLEIGDLKTAARKAGAAALDRYADAYEKGMEEEKAAQQEGTEVDGVVIPLSVGVPIYHVRDKERVIGFRTPDNGFVTTMEAKANLGKGGKS